MRETRASPAQLRWLACHEPDRFPCLFDSPSGGPLGRRTLLPLATGASLVLWGDGRLEATGEGARALAGGFLASLDAWWAAEAARAPAPGPGPRDGAAVGPFAGGWCLYMAYEFAAQVEPRLALPALPSGQPLAWAGRVDAVAEIDAASGRCRLLAGPGAGARLDELDEALSRAARALGPALGDGEEQAPVALPAATAEEDPPGRFTEAVRAAQEAIAAGDIYQANLSRAWRLRFAREPGVAALYDALVWANPAPFAALARLPGDAWLLSSSPERLVRVQGGRVETRPIAGTRPRSDGGAATDMPERAALLAHPKERAEHVMLIDLERNDLGRICEAGSVVVDEFMVTETYRHVHHIASNVSGRLRAGTTPGEVLRAVFPGGTITGCPKLRSIEVIAVLEGTARGPYTGSLGYLAPDGAMDMNILIRTALVRGDTLELRAGAGIVADSDPRRELAETRAKARGLLRAFGAGQ